MAKENPIFNASRATGEVGVSIVQSIIVEELGWIFRRNFQDFDFGIDGFIDLIAEHGQVTGKSIAIQIKCGSSFFKENNEVGWLFRGEKKHLNYLMNLDIPILIILVDPELRKAYWCKFDVNSTLKAGENWTISIPKKNELSRISKAELVKITKPYTDYLPQLEHFWKMDNALKEHDYILIMVEKEDVEAGEVDGVLKVFERFDANRDLIKKMRGKVDIAIHGYDNDDRELFEVPEVKKWVKTILWKYKYWAYFLKLETGASGLSLLQFCSTDIVKLSDKQIQIDTNQVKQVFDYLLDGLDEFCKIHDIDKSTCDKMMVDLTSAVYQIDVRIKNS